SRVHSRIQLRLIGHFNRWLEQKDLTVEQIDEEIVERYWRYFMRKKRVRSKDVSALMKRLCCKQDRGGLVRCIVTRKRPALFRGRHFEDVIILLCVRWYLRYSLTYRDLEEIMAERGLSIDHVTIWRWVQRYAPVLNQRIRHEVRRPNRSWRVDETYVKVAGDWAYLYRAVDSTGETIEFMLSPKRDLIAAKLFLRLALSGGGPSPQVINVDGHPAYASAIAELKQSG